MSDPIQTRRPAPPPATPPPEDQPRKSASPLIWILVLIALIAFGWYFYNRQSAHESITDLTAPAATSDAMTPAQSSSAEKATSAKPKPAARPAKPVAKAAPPISRAAALIGEPHPSYPPEAYRAREEGTVLVMAQVDAMGNANDVEIVKRSGSRVLDRAAINEVRQWKFKPAMKNGKAVASSVKVPVDYRLGTE